MFVMRPDLFMDLDDFRAGIDHHLESLRATGQPGAVHLPGDVAAVLEEEQSMEGIPVGDVLLGQLRELAARLGLEDRLD
jgi:LDH2 family malate/lactate/ureidoglycolate dehydrogenase